MRTAPVVLELSEAVLRLDEALPEEGVVHRLRPDVGDPPLVAHDHDLSVDALDLELVHLADATRS